MNNYKKVLSIFMFMFLFAAAFAIGTCNTQAAESSMMKVKVSAKFGQTDARKIATLINNLRTGSDNWLYDSNGKKVESGALPKLKYDYNLEKLAMMRAVEISLDFSHTRPDGQPYYHIYDEGDGTMYTAVGENIAVGQKDYKKAFAAWEEADKNYDGQSHRRQMLSSAYSAIGVGHAYVNGTHYWVTMFGNKKSSMEKTTAYNDSYDVAVTVPADKIDGKKVTFSADEITVNVESKVAVPVAKTGIIFPNTWKGKAVNVIVPVTWKAYNEAIAKVTDNKEVTPVSIGTTTLRTKVNGVDYKVKLKVRPKATSVVKTKAGKKKFTLTLKQIKSEATGYEVQYATNNKFTKAKKVQIKDLTKLSVTIKNLKAKTTYYVRVRTFATKKTEGENPTTTTYNSSWSKTKKVKTLK